MRRQPIRGFTLIEIMVVIMIMAILMSLIFPVARMAIENARRSACMSNLQLIAQAVQTYQQDYLVYPEMPNYVSLHGIPAGGLTGVALSNPDLTQNGLWCKQDTFPEQFPMDERDDANKITANGFVRDTTGSSYAYGYNYYGLVTTTDGLPFPITTQQAWCYFYGDPTKLDPNAAFPTGTGNWDLGIVKPDTYSTTDYLDTSPVGLTRGLLNPRAPSNTIVTFCTNHQPEKIEVLPCVTLAGEAMALKPPQPQLTKHYGTAKVSGYINRYPEPVDTSQLPPAEQAEYESAPPIPAIDWRINLAPFAGKGSAVNNYMFGDSKLSSAKRMPIVEVYYRLIDLGKNELNIDNNGFKWYDTGIDVRSGDMVMIISRGRALPQGQGAYAGSQYQILLANGKLWFTSDGDPVDARAIKDDPRKYPEILLPTRPTATPWAAATAYTESSWVTPGTPNGRYYRCIKAGTSEAMEPAWPTRAGETVAEGANGPVWVLIEPKPYPPGMLVGSIGGIVGDVDDEGNRYRCVFPIGSRGSCLVNDSMAPGGNSYPIRLSMNEIKNQYGNEKGWYEVWIAVYRPQDLMRKSVWNQ